MLTRSLYISDDQGEAHHMNQDAQLDTVDAATPKPDYIELTKRRIAFLRKKNVELIDIY